MKRLALIFTLALFITTFLLSQPCLPEGITFSTQEQIDNFPSNNPNCTDIEGDVTISGNDITNLNGLSGLTSIGGSLKIGDLQGSGNPLLINLEGLESLDSISGGLRITSNDALIDLTGLDNLTTVSYFQLGRNDALLSLNGLNNLTNINEFFAVYQNNLIANLNGLEKLEHIGGIEFFIGRCNSLISLDGLLSLDSIKGRFEIWDCPMLENLEGLENLKFIEGDVMITDNDTLSSLIGLENINAEFVTDLSIYNNKELTFCEVQSICSYLSNPNGEVVIQDNTIGCNSEHEVEEACATVSIEEHNITDLKIRPNPFSTSTTIEYKLNQPQTVTITFYNQFGKQVDVIEESQQRGLNKLIWTPENLADGIYYFRLKAGEEVASGKVVLMR